MTTRSFRVLLVLGALLLAACGGAAGDAAPKAASPAREESPAVEPRTVEEAQEQIARFSGELGAGLPKPAPASQPESTSSQSRPPPSPPSEAAKTDSDHFHYDSCSSPCRALASMRRAVDALCRMTGETDNRCVDAKKTLADSVGRTSSCKCGS